MSRTVRDVLIALGEEQAKNRDLETARLKVVGLQLEAEKERRRRDRAGAGGPPRGDGLTREMIVAKVAELWAGGDRPGQEAVADALGCTARTIRNVQGDDGWEAIVEDARRRLR